MGTAPCSASWACNIDQLPRDALGETTVAMVFDISGRNVAGDERHGSSNAGLGHESRYSQQNSECRIQIRKIAFTPSTVPENLSLWASTCEKAYALPFRFNLSNSGIGVSAGIKGFRVGTGPRGNYVHMGRGRNLLSENVPA